MAERPFTLEQSSSRVDSRCPLPCRSKFSCQVDEVIPDLILQLQHDKFNLGYVNNAAVALSGKASHLAPCPPRLWFTS